MPLIKIFLNIITNQFIYCLENDSNRQIMLKYNQARLIKTNFYLHLEVVKNK